MAGIKRRSDAQPVRSRAELLADINKMSSLRNKALASFIYLTGMRISECLGTKKYMPKADRTVIVQPLTARNIEVLPEKDLVIVNNVPSLKRKGLVPYRNIPIIISKERGFIDHFLNFYNTLKEDDPLFNISRGRAWAIINKELKIYNHFLIHQRCTHLVSHLSFTDQDLVRFRGWANSMHASTYTHLSTADLVAKMRKD